MANSVNWASLCVGVLIRRALLGFFLLGPLTFGNYKIGIVHRISGMGLLGFVFEVLRWLA